MKFSFLVEQLLVEASKKDILINKLGLSEDRAEFLSKLCGPLSVWIANKLIEKQITILHSWGKEIDKKIIIDTINKNNLIFTYRQKIIGIMDWVRVELNGNVTPYKNLTLDQLVEKSEEWHKSLGVGGGVINYVEEHPIMLDFRKDKLGFYWADLETNNSPEECERMGHCGRSAGNNNLYSLRQYVKFGDKYTKNISHLTASVDPYGIIVQMKGPKNSKPNDEFHPYIIPFILTDTIKGFGSEYNSKNDFKLSDLKKDEIISIYQKKPELFNAYAERKLLEDLGIIEKTNKIFGMVIDPSNLNSYIDGDYVVGRRKDKNGNEYKVRFFETFFSGDMWELWDPHSYDGDWEGAIDYYLDKENENKIWEIIREIAQKNNIDLTDLSLEDAIKEVDADDVISAIRGAISDAESDSYYVYIRKQFTYAIEEYGKIQNMDDTGIVIDIDLDDFLQNLGNDEINELFENCNNKLECVFNEMVYNGNIEKPEFTIDDRWSPDVDSNTFNENLKWRLDEI